MNKTALNLQLKNYKNSIVNILHNKFFNYFANHFQFEGDKKFTAQKQFLFFGGLGTHGEVGVKNQALTTTKDAHNRFERVVYLALQKNYTVDALLKKGYGLLASRVFPLSKIDNNHFTESLTMEDTAFCNVKDLHSFSSPRNLINPLILQIAENFVNLEKAKHFSLGKLFGKNFTDEQAETFAEVKDFLGNNEVFIIPLKDFDESKFKKIDIITADQVRTMAENIKNSLLLIFQILGMNANVSAKKERMISVEAEQDQAEFLPAELTLQRQLNVFITNYESVFKTKLTLTNNYEQQQHGSGTDETRHLGQDAPSEQSVLSKGNSDE